MKAVFVTGGRLDEHLFFDGGISLGGDVLVLADGILDDVDYACELRGEDEIFTELATLSKARNCTLIAGCTTVLFGVKKKSALVFDRGHVLGVADSVCVREGEDFSPGSGLSVFETSAGKLGVIAGADVYVPEVARVLAACDSVALIILAPYVTDAKTQLFLRAIAVQNGIPCALCALDCCAICNAEGELLYASNRRVSSCEMPAKAVGSTLLFRGRYSF